MLIKALIRAKAVAARVPNGERGQLESLQPTNGSFPRVLDLYLLRRLLYYFAMLMVTFVFLFETFTFFELLDDIARHRVPFLVVVDYFRYLAPYLLYPLERWWPCW